MSLPTPKSRPAEFSAPAVLASLYGLLVAFGVDPAKAGAIAGIVASVAPGFVSFLIDRFPSRRG